MSDFRSSFKVSFFNKLINSDGLNLFQNNEPHGDISWLVDIYSFLNSLLLGAFCVEAAFLPRAASIMAMDTQRGHFKYVFTIVCFGIWNQTTVSRCPLYIVKQQGGQVEYSAPALRNRKWVRNLLPVMFKYYVICHGILSHTSTLHSFRPLRSRLVSVDERY